MVPFLRVFKRKARFVGTGYGFGDYGKVSARNIRAERMTSSVSLPFMDEDPCTPPAYGAGTMGVSPRRRVQRSDRYQPAVGSHDTGCVPAISRDGVSGSMACVLLVCLIFSLGVAYLVGRSQVIEAGKRVSSMESRIEDITQMNEELETQLAASASEVNVGYEAVQLGMISARGVDVIYLNAPDDADITLAGAGTSLSGEHLATILGD